MPLSLARAKALSLCAPPIPPHLVTATATATATHFCRVGSPLRRAFSAVTAPPQHEAFDVDCRSNGSIRIDVFHSPLPSSPIIIYLPPGPVVPDRAQEEEQVISTLRDSGAATVARIQYRASQVHQYPTPYHDVLFGYDWLRENLLRDEFKRPYLARLGICGELVGGSLATMLALTECRLGESRIGAAAVNNPIVDWVFPDDLPAVGSAELPEPMAPEETSMPADEDMAGTISFQLEEAIQKPGRGRKKRTPKPPPSTAWQLHGDNAILPTVTLSAERNTLFHRPDDYLDRFASPIHFFRSPHVQLVQPQHDDILASQQPDDILDLEAQMALDHYASFDRQTKIVAAQMPVLTRCRAYARNYPPAGTNLSLPMWHITTGSHSPLHGQATELTKMLRRSIARHKLKSFSGRSRWHDASEKEQFEEYAEGRVLLNTQDGLGLWSQQNDKGWQKARVEEMAVWLKHHLKPEFS